MLILTTREPRTGEMDQTLIRLSVTSRVFSSSVLGVACCLSGPNTNDLIKPKSESLFVTVLKPRSSVKASVETTRSAKDRLAKSSYSVW